MSRFGVRVPTTAPDLDDGFGGVDGRRRVVYATIPSARNGLVGLNAALRSSPWHD
jgi:hypothetical protein